MPVVCSAGLRGPADARGVIKKCGARCAAIVGRRAMALDGSRAAIGAAKEQGNLGFAWDQVW